MSSGEAGRRDCCCCRPRYWFADGGAPLGVEFDGFQSLAPVCLIVRADAALPAVCDRPLLNGEGFPPPINAVRRLQRVGLLTLTCGSGEVGIEIGAG